MYIDEAHTALDIFRFAAFFLVLIEFKMNGINVLVPFDISNHPSGVEGVQAVGSSFMCHWSIIQEVLEDILDY